MPFVAKYAMLASMQKTSEALIGATEAAEVLGVSKDTLIRMSARGDLEPVHKLPAANGAYLFRRADVLALAAKRAGQARATA